MFRLAMPVLGLAALLTIPAQAQAQARAFADRSVVSQELAASTTVVADLLDRGSQLAIAGNYRKAAHAYHSAAAEQLRNGELPDSALWQEANMYFTLNENSRAAVILDNLAEHASEFGNPAVEVKAKLNAAILYARTGNVERAAVLATELQMLRKSPFIGDEMRAELDLRLGRE